MNEDKIKKYNEHAKFLAEIASRILDWNTEMLKENNWIKELISFYLLIPYISKNQLVTPDEKCKIPKIIKSLGKTDNWKEITLSSLRDSMCHSFVTIEWNNNDGSNYITFDDRAYCKNKDEHDNLKDKCWCCRIKVNDAHQLLINLLSEIMEQ